MRLTRSALPIFAFAISLFVTFSARAESAASADASAGPPGWDKLVTLSGKWEGVGHEGAKSLPVTTEFHFVADKSVLMNTLAAGTPHEMITMFHDDGGTLMATHYCAMHNQPRLYSEPAKAANQLSFLFKDSTNIGPGDAHMKRLVITFVDATHHLEDWSAVDEEGKESVKRFEFHRKQ